MKKQSITELRAIAQNMGAKWDFSDDINALKQKIAMRQTDMLPPPIIPVVATPEDQRLRTRAPSRISDEDVILPMLQPYIDRGLKVRFEDGQFYFKRGERTDSGTLRQPPRVVLGCAARMFE